MQKALVLGPYNSHDRHSDFRGAKLADGGKYGFKPALNTLIAKVSRLEPLEEKYTQGYYLAAANAVGWTSELAYGMGALQQEVLDEEEEAAQWFRKAYSANPFNLCALFRLALNEEDAGN